MVKFTPDSLRKLFQSSFNLKQWYSFLQHFFCASELNKPERIIENTSDEGYYLGKVDTTDSCRIGLFHYNIRQGSVVNKRVELRNLVKLFLRYEFDAALVVFESDEHWRLSFIYDIKGEVESLKRYTFVFGCKDLVYRTPIERFNFLKKKGVSFENLRKVFSAETLSNEFFDKYREQYADFVQYVIGKRLVKVGGKWEEKLPSEPNATLMQAFDYNEKKIRDYVKKMLGRITFLHFLQRKGWMCGDLNYMQNMFENSPYKNDYLTSVLEPLFFGVLNTEPAGRKALFIKEKWDESLLNEWKDIAYLNGGLFECDDIDKIYCDFPADYFKRLFNFFSEYNFSIDENDPNDAEVAVAPEILGKIFENLLEDNKDKGAFYTPKEIVRYMCQESLIAYLETNTNIPKEKIRRFILAPEEGVADVPENKKNKLLTVLEEVKICDPAIGSGAFTIGMLNELLHCREVLSGKYSTRAEIKKSIIRNNIYGADIEKGAVDVARMRFLLSVVVDEENPLLPPNLDYKIMQGNSLTESFMGVDLSKLIYEKKTVSHLLSLYNSCSERDIKIKLQQEISDTVNKQLEAQGCDPEILRELRNINLVENDKFFLWHTFFGDVFNRDNDKNGFDIVIGNPPYIGEKGHKEIFQPVKADVHLGEFYLGKMDYYYFFFHQAFNLLHTNGVATFITTNYYTTALGARKLRADIKKRMNIRSLLNFGELRLFENAIGQHNMISSFSKGGETPVCRVIDVHKKGVFNSSVFNSIVNRKDVDTSYAEIEQKDLYDGEDNYIRLENYNGYKPLLPLLNKMFARNKSLGDIAEINSGIMGGCDKITKHNIKYSNATYIGDNDIRKDDGVFVLDYSCCRDCDRINIIKDYSFCKDFYKNSDITRYCTNESTTKKIIFSSSDTSTEEQEIIKSYLSKYQPILTKIRKINNEKNDYWYQLRRGTAHRHIFTSAKIVCPQRSKKNTFGYNECDWYASADVYYITNPSKDYHIKYILGLLNSKLYYVWLYYKGKRKGDTLELYQKPLSEIPIKKVSPDIQNLIVNIVDKIISLKKSNPRCDVSASENQIDEIVYRIYKLTDAEIKFVEDINRL